MFNRLVHLARATSVVPVLLLLAACEPASDGSSAGPPREEGGGPGAGVQGLGGGGAAHEGDPSSGVGGSRADNSGGTFTNPGPGGASTGEGTGATLSGGASSGPVGGAPSTSGGASMGTESGGTGTAGGSTAATGGTIASTGGSGEIDPGPVTAEPEPFEATTALTSVRKVKNLLVGLPPTDADVAMVAESGAAGLQSLISQWMTDEQFAAYFRDKMLGFFRTTFQQVGFTPTEDFKPQLLENGGFDFGPIGYRGDDAFARIVQNLQDSFALTAWSIVAEGRPFTETLTTRRFMMTTALLSLYLQIEMPNDEPYNFLREDPIEWRLDLSGRDIPLEDSINPSSADYMVFSDVPPTTATTNFLTPTCQGESRVLTFTGYAQLFQRLLGFTPRYPYVAAPECWEHPSRPYFTAADLTDWRWVDIRPLANGETLVQPFQLPTLRQATELALNLPRTGFYTTPAYLAIWNTNNSNQHRVTANQTLIVALGRSFTPDNVVIPIDPTGLDAEHSVEGTDCYACHKNLDPMKQFWSGHFDFDDRNDFPTSTFFGGVANPRPDETGGVFAYGNVNAAGADIYALGDLLTQVTVAGPSGDLSRFAVAMTQKLCFYANSATCLDTDAEFLRLAEAFQNSGYNLPTLIREMFSSAIVTGAELTDSYADGGMPVSILRRDHFCAALSNRLSLPDICAQAVPARTREQTVTNTIAASVPADAFSRGSETIVTPAKATLFFRAASEMLCENVAAMVVDGTVSNLYSSSDPNVAFPDMVEKLMGYPPGDARHAAAVAILDAHYASALSSGGQSSARNALRSTFSLACQAPTALSVGL